MPENKYLRKFGNRLRLARKMAGFSMEDLVKKSKGVVTKQAISKYEKGIMKPSSDVLIRLALALGVKPEYFFRHTTIDLSGMQFRKRTKLPVKIIESLKQRTFDFLERYIELESILGVKQKFLNPLSDFEVDTLQDVENAALKLRDAWELGLAPISNLLELLEENGIRVHEVHNIDAFDGLSARVGALNVIVINRGGRFIYRPNPFYRGS